MVTVSLENLSVGYREPLLEGLQLQMCGGTLTALLGLNGTGKSTLLKTLCGTLKPLGGEIKVMGKPLGSYSRSALASLVGVVLTERTAAGGMSLYNLVAMGRYPHTDFLGSLKEADRKIIADSMEAVGIAGKASAPLCFLSDGERQKGFIAKALAQECPIVILDEPTAFLDIKSRYETMELLSHLARAKDMSILLSTHDLDTAVRFADTLWVADSQEHSVHCGTAANLAARGIFEKVFSAKVAATVYSSLSGK